MAAKQTTPEEEAAKDRGLSTLHIGLITGAAVAILILFGVLAYVYKSRKNRLKQKALVPWVRNGTSRSPFDKTGIVKHLQQQAP